MYLNAVECSRCSPRWDVDSDDKNDFRAHHVTEIPIHVFDLAYRVGKTIEGVAFYTSIRVENTVSRMA